MANEAPVKPTTNAPVSPTYVSITKANGEKVVGDMMHLSAADAAVMYAALGQVDSPTKYQEMADVFAGLARNFKSIQSLNLPIGMTYQQAINNFGKMLRENKGKLKENLGEGEAYLRDMAKTPFGEALVQSEFYKNVESTAHVANTVGSIATGVMRPFDAAGKTYDAVTGTTGELWNQAGWGVSDAQAKAVGTAYAVAHYMSGPDGPKATVNREANGLDKFLAWTETSWDKVWHLVPANVAAYITGAIKFAMSGFKDWNESHALALKEATEARSKPAPEMETVLAARMEKSINEKARPRALELLARAETVAGVETKPIAEAMKYGAVYRGQDGTMYELSFDDKGAPKSAPLKGEDGKPLTLNKRLADQWREVGKAIMPQNSGEVVGEVLFVAAATSAAPAVGSAAGSALAAGAKVAEKVTAFTAAAVGAAVASPAGIAGVRTGWATEAKAERVLAELVAKEQALKESIAAARAAAAELEAAKGESTGVKALKDSWARSRASRNIASLEDDLVKVGEKLNGSKGWFGHVKKGAVELAQEARSATSANMASGSKFARMNLADDLAELGASAQKSIGSGFSWAMGKLGFEASANLAKAAPLMTKAGSALGSLAAPLAVGVTPTLAVIDMVNGDVNGDKAKVVNAKGDLVSYAGDAVAGVAGAALVAVAGGAAVLSAPVIAGGALLGITVGGVVSLFDGGAHKKVTNEELNAADNKTRTIPAKPTGKLTADAAMTGEVLKAEAARAKAQADASAQVAKKAYAPTSASFVAVVSTSPDRIDMAKLHAAKPLVVG
ncbi:MAG: hypothetical protein V4735_03455 [Pseudomonadota bacterium]